MVAASPLECTPLTQVVVSHSRCSVIWMDSGRSSREEWMALDGVGDPNGEYWLGLKNIHCLTTRTEVTQLKVCLADFESVKTFANYSFFYVGNTATKYRLNIGGYSGTAGDAMKRHI